MITVNKFEVSADRLSLALKVTVGSGELVSSILLWTDATYKVQSQATNLSSLIVGTGIIEEITISASDAGVSSFDGIYFLQIDNDNATDAPGMVATLSLTRYYAVLAALLANVDLSCLNCNNNFQNALLLDMYVEAMKNSIKIGRFGDSIQFLKKINIFEEISCGECSNINPVVSTAGNIVSVGVVDCILDL
tara:strand:- start:19867 stop:20442 length:576 start_codon:yes stop_codon:yes gene_type:complete